MITERHAARWPSRAGAALRWFGNADDIDELLDAVRRHAR
jgi:hypothetical protein